jgi:sirohydrochlorin ferrochelatase
VKTGVIVFAHGSRVESANEAVRIVARQLAVATGRDPVIAAFLELGRPDMEAAAAHLAAVGMERIVVIPFFLTLGLHLERDLPRLIARTAEIHKSLQVVVTPPLDGHPALVSILADRLGELDLLSATHSTKS